MKKFVALLTNEKEKIVMNEWEKDDPNGIYVCILLHMCWKSPERPKWLH